MTTNNEEKDLLKKQTTPVNTDSGVVASAASPGDEYKPYVASDSVKQAQSMLQQQMTGNQGQYGSAWQSQLNDTINKILNREKFSYDLNGDALYQQYKDQYINQGKMAMMDTMGQAQAMTGGYGNSYAQSVGQQAYQGQLQQLNDKIPELYQLAMNKYQMEGDELAKQYSVLGNQFANDRAFEYQVDRDKVADEQWQKEFDEALRQFNFANKLGEFAPVASGGGGGDSYRKPATSTEDTETTETDTVPDTSKITFADVGKTAANIAASGGSASDYINAARQAGVISTNQMKSLKYTFGY